MKATEMWFTFQKMSCRHLGMLNYFIELVLATQVEERKTVNVNRGWQPVGVLCLNLPFN